MARPDLRAGHVDGDHLPGAEHRVDPLAVGDRAGARQVVLVVHRRQAAFGGELDSVHSALAVDAIERLDQKADAARRPPAPALAERPLARRGVGALPEPRAAAGARRAPTCEVTKTRSPQTIGDETPTPPSGVFQAMFCVSLQRLRQPRLAPTRRLPAGPRHCGQFSADSVAPSNTIASAAAGQVFLVDPIKALP